MKRILKRIALRTLLVLIKLAISTSLAAGTAAVLVPLAYQERGYEAIGGEWILIVAVFCITYSILHKGLCSIIFKEE